MPCDLESRHLEMYSKEFEKRTKIGIFIIYITETRKET